MANVHHLTGAETGRILLQRAGLWHVDVDPAAGELSDHYDPSARTVRLSEGVYRVPSVAALAIAAHEVGHAHQDATGYLPLRFRSGILPLIPLGSMLGWLFFVAGIMLATSHLV